jgi:hypothetical protein
MMLERELNPVPSTPSAVQKSAPPAAPHQQPSTTRASLSYSALSNINLRGVHGAITRNSTHDSVTTCRARSGGLQYARMPPKFAKSSCVASCPKTLGTCPTAPS